MLFVALILTSELSKFTRNGVILKNKYLQYKIAPIASLALCDIDAHIKNKIKCVCANMLTIYRVRVPKIFLFSFLSEKFFESSNRCVYQILTLDFHIEPLTH